MGGEREGRKKKEEGTTKIGNMLTRISSEADKRQKYGTLYNSKLLTSVTLCKRYLTTYIT